jgi:SPP1 gp7 family putative phage head morphogenesis protein
MALPRAPWEASLVYQRLGRTPPAPGPVTQRAPQVAPIAAPYVARVRVFWSMWRAVVETYARAELGERHDARGPRSGRDLDDAFASLLDAAGVDTAATQTARRASAAQASYTARVTKIPGFGLATRDQALKYAEEEFRKVNVSLITDMGRAHLAKVQRIMRASAAAGLRWEDVAPELQRELGIGERRAKLIARDQTNKIVSDMARLHQQAAGIEEYTWRTAGDLAVRGRPGGEYERSESDHWHLEGRRFRWDSAPVTNDSTGERNHPGQDIQCRCTAEPVIPAFAPSARAPAPPARKPRAAKQAPAV